MQKSSDQDSWIWFHLCFPIRCPSAPLQWQPPRQNPTTSLQKSAPAGWLPCFYHCPWALLCSLLTSTVTGYLHGETSALPPALGARKFGRARYVWKCQSRYTLTSTASCRHSCPWVWWHSPPGLHTKNTVRALASLHAESLWVLVPSPLPMRWGQTITDVIALSA